MSTNIELSLPAAGSIEALEQTHQGAGFSLLLDSTVVLLDGGEPTGPRTSAYYASLSVRTGQDTLDVAPHDWSAVLEGWKRGMGITVLVPLGASDPNPLRVDIVDHLRIARVKLDGADTPARSRDPPSARATQGPALTHIAAPAIAFGERAESAATDFCSCRRAVQLRQRAGPHGSAGQRLHT